MRTDEEAQARVLAVSEVLMRHLPRLENMPGSFGSYIETLTRREVRELTRNEPIHLINGRLIELYCLELIEAVKDHRQAAGLP